MPNYTKLQLAERLRKAGVTPPPIESTSAKELQSLLDRVNALPRTAPGRPPLARKAPSAPASRPKFGLANPAVNPPAPVTVGSDHDLRPFDPFAGW